MVNIKIKRLSNEAIIPTKATHGSAAYDLVVPRDTLLRPGRQVIPLDLAIELPDGYEAKVEPRSGYASKGFVATRVATEYRIDADVIVGKIDSDYRGGIGVIVKSYMPYTYTIKAGQRIAQLTIYKCEDACFDDVEELSNTGRGDKGYGHSGR